MLNAFLLLFVIITWGYSWVLMKIALEFMSPLTLATWRCAVGGLAMIPFLYVKGGAFPQKRKLPDYIFVGIFQTTGMFALMLSGMKFVSAGKTSVLLYTMSLWTSLLAHFYLKETLNASRWLGVICGSAGLLFILGWDVIMNQNAEILFGEFLIVMAAVSWAVANIWTKKNMTAENPYMVNGLQMLIGTSGLVLILLPTEGLFNIEWTRVSAAIILFTGIVASAVDFSIWFYLLKKLDTHTAAFSVIFVPVTGLFFDWLILDRTVDTGVIIGGALIMVGIYKVSKNQKIVES